MLLKFLRVSIICHFGLGYWGSTLAPERRWVKGVGEKRFKRTKKKAPGRLSKQGERKEEGNEDAVMGTWGTVSSRLQPT